MKFSASMLKTWSTCPLQAHFKATMPEAQREQHAKTTFGTVIHHCLEHYNQDGDVEKAKKRFLHFWNNPELLEDRLTVTSWRGSSYGALRERGIKILENYDEKLQWEHREVIATEHKFCVPFGEHLISGIVDLLEFKPSGRGVPTLKIVDYKTSSRQPTIAELRMDIQFTIYTYASLQPEFWLGFPDEGGKYPPMENGEALMERFDGVPRRAAWYHLWGHKEIDAGERDEADFLRLYRLLEGVAKANEAEVFIPSINADSCTWCDFKEVCPSTSLVLDRIDVEPGGDGDDTMF